MSDFRTTPDHSEKMPRGIPYIISNEAAERFSFYGMKAALAIFLANYLGVMGGANFTEAQATSAVSSFTSWVYFTPLLGALIADAFFGKYRTIVTLSIVYCLGHLSLAFMGVGGTVQLWLISGLGLIALGAGGIKPCVSAHVGDQFGSGNQHLLTRIFNIFYFSINFGAVIANLLIPVILMWYGPHLAFGLPGILMLLATIFFWMGRRKFIHVPAKGSPFLREIFSREGLSAIAKLAPVVLFVGMFWCLFDQTASRFVFQAQRMNRDIFGVEVLPSQIQAFNPFLILLLIPVFTFVIYPTVEKKVRLTPLRKIGAGLFLMIGSFVIVALAQEAIDRGETPHVAWQLLAYLILTAAEVMVSIVGLEFFYTQAPKRMKSFMMAIFLLSVWFGNQVTKVTNDYIQIPSVEFVDGKSTGADGKDGTADDIAKSEDGKTIKSPASDLLRTTAEQVVDVYKKDNANKEDKDKRFPLDFSPLPDDPWGKQLRYVFADAGEVRIISDGSDGKPNTEWDLGVTLKLKSGTEQKGTWLYKQKLKLGLLEENVDPENPIKFTYTAGGGVKLEGAAYFWFFTILMSVTAVLFVPFALAYKSRTYLQDESTPDNDLTPTKP